MGHPRRRVHEDLAPPGGLCHLSGRHTFIVDWWGRTGLPVGSGAAALSVPDDGSGLPRTTVLNVSPLGSAETVEEEQGRAWATTEVQRVCAHGVRWNWADRSTAKRLGEFGPLLA